MSNPNEPKTLDAVPSGFFAFRTPLLPFDALTAWSEGLTAPLHVGGAQPEGADDAGSTALGDALAKDRALLERRLRTLVGQPEIREALFVASPSLDDAIEAWLRDPASERA